MLSLQGWSRLALPPETSIDQLSDNSGLAHPAVAINDLGGSNQIQQLLKLQLEAVWTDRLFGLIMG